MHIQLESAEPHAIQAYSDDKIQINSIIYEGSFIVSPTAIIRDLAIKNIQDMNAEYLDLLLQSKPELIIIGHKNNGIFPPMPLINQLTQLHIGIESMSIAAACRTYNVLISEHRAVVAGFIF